MSYKGFIKSKLPIKKSKNKEGYCRFCNIKLTRENKKYYSHGYYSKSECTKCITKRNSSNTKRKEEILKKNPLW